MKCFSFYWDSTKQLSTHFLWHSTFALIFRYFILILAGYLLLTAIFTIFISDYSIYLLVSLLLLLLSSSKNIFFGFERSIHLTYWLWIDSHCFAFRCWLCLRALLAFWLPLWVFFRLRGLFQLYSVLNQTFLHRWPSFRQVVFPPTPSNDHYRPSKCWS